MERGRPMRGDRRALDIVRLGLWMFLATVTMLFAAFTSALHRAAEQRRLAAGRAAVVLWVNTACSCASSADARSARCARASGAGGARRCAACVAAAASWASGSSPGRWLAWRRARRGRRVPADEPARSFFYMMTGAHAVHVVAALALLAWSAVATWTRRGARDAESGRYLAGVVPDVLALPRRRLGVSAARAAARV